MKLGDRIKNARERAKLTQKAVADGLRITPQAVSGWERGESIPDVDKLPKLARRLKVPLDWLLEGTGEPPVMDDLQAALSQLEPHERAAVATVVHSYLRGRQVA